MIRRRRTRPAIVEPAANVATWNDVDRMARDLRHAEEARDALSDTLGRVLPTALDVVEQLRDWAHNGDLPEYERNVARSLADRLERTVMS